MNKKYEDLSDSEKFEFLSWIKEGLKFNTKQAVMQATYVMLINDLEGKRTFSPDAIWDRLHDRNVQHLKHIKPYLEAIDCCRAEVLGAAQSEETIQPKKKDPPVSQENDLDSGDVDNGDD